MKPVVCGTVVRVNDMNEARKAFRLDDELPAVCSALDSNRQTKVVTIVRGPLR